MTHEIQNFTFQNPTKILFGRNRIEDIDNEQKQNETKK